MERASSPSKHPISRSLSGTPAPVISQYHINTDGPVDTSEWEADFRRLDSDGDGLVTGDDVKSFFLQTGVPQSTLANIWNLCDMKFTGRLNLEQFALAMYLIERKRNEKIDPPVVLPAELVPPCCRPSQQNLIDVEPGELPSSGSVTTPFSKEMEQIKKEIEDMQLEKRELEAHIVQSEADMKVKQAEIRNLEVEFNTLEATINQLKRQKLAASQRLEELENQRLSLEKTVDDLKEEVKAKEDEWITLKEEVETACSFAKQQQEVVEAKQKEIQGLREEEHCVEEKIQSQRTHLNALNEQERVCEQDIEKLSNDVRKLKAQRKMLADHLSSAGDGNLSYNLTQLLEKNELFLPPLESVVPSKNSVSFDQFTMPANDEHVTASAGLINDPFLVSDDPFAHIGFGSEYPFEQFSATDPFQKVTPFTAAENFNAAEFEPNQQPFQAHESSQSNDAFIVGCCSTLNNGSSSVSNKAFDPWNSQAVTAEAEQKKRPPPRPAAPPNHAAAPNVIDDPFNPTRQTGVDASLTFANFADFSNLVSDYFCPNTGGVESHIYHLASCLMKLGHKVIVVTHTYGERRGVVFLRNGIKVYYLPFLVFHEQCSLPTFFVTLPAARFILIREKVNLVHGHSSLSTMAQEFMLHARMLGIHTVFTDHSLFGFSDLASISGNKMLQFSLVNCDLVICVSHTSKENTVLRAKLPANRVYVIPNALNPDYFKPAPVKPNSSRITIIVAGRMVYRKGVDLLASVLPMVCSRYDCVDFIIAGDGPKRILLEETRERHSLQERLRLIGNVPHNRMGQVLACGQIFLNTSLTEAFCTTILEAASCGLHVVSTNVGGIPEVLPSDLITLAEPSVQGIVDALDSAIERYWANSLPNPMEVHARIRHMYSWSDVAERTEHVYFDALKRSIDSHVVVVQKYLRNGYLFGILMYVVAIVEIGILKLLSVVSPVCQ
ncbi:glycosyltransferase, group 1 family protein [Trichuris suis]|nr:glycosyltransferase, group 1 family protein [Trichuris suis]